jgi:hypothetical protein
MLYNTTFREDIEDVYTIQLCDGSIFKINVSNGGDDMLLGLLIFLPIIIGFGLMYWGSQLEEDHWFLKLLFQMLFLPLVLISINFGVLGTMQLYPSNFELVNLLTDVAYYTSWTLALVGFYSCLYIIWMVVKVTNAAGKLKQDEKYGEGEKNDNS